MGHRQRLPFLVLLLVSSSFLAVLEITLWVCLVNSIFSGSGSHSWVDDWNHGLGMVSWPLLRCALIVQLLWVNRDEQAIEGKLLNHLIWSRARFQRWRHKTSRPPSPAMTRVESNCLQITLFCKELFPLGHLYPKVDGHQVPKKAGLPVCQRDALICFNLELVPISLFQSPLAGWKFV